MKKKKKKHKNTSMMPFFIILAFIAAFCGAIFAACGGSDSDKESGSSSNPSEVVVSELASGEHSSGEGNTSSSENSSEYFSEAPSADVSEAASADTSADTSEDMSSIDVDLNGEKFSYISWYKAENSDRYALYEIENPDFTDEQIVTYVNIGLDKPYYTNTYKADTSDGIFILVNKYSYVDRNFTPANLVTLSSECSAKNGVQLVKEAADAFAELSADAKALEYSILGMSGYRTYAYQESLYNRYLKNDTQANVDKYSARPGHSEHHTGLALDVQAGSGYFADFGQSKEYEWLLDNAHKYGFAIHYTEDNQWITGYMPEEWHIRYLGVEAATYIYDNNLSVDEYLVMFGSESPSDKWEKFPESEEDSSEIVENATSEATSEATSDATSEAMSEATSEATSENTSEATSDAMSDATSEATSDATSDATSEATSEATSDAMSDAMSEAMSDATSDATSEATSENTSEATSEAISDATSDATSDAMSDATSEANYTDENR